MVYAMTFKRYEPKPTVKIQAIVLAPLVAATLPPQARPTTKIQAVVL